MFLQYLRKLYIVWSLVRCRVTRHPARLQTMCNVLKYCKIFKNGLVRLRFGCVFLIFLCSVLYSNASQVRQNILQAFTHKQSSFISIVQTIFHRNFFFLYFCIKFYCVIIFSNLLIETTRTNDHSKGFVLFCWIRYPHISVDSSDIPIYFKQLSGQQIRSKIESFQNANFLISQPNPIVWPFIGIGSERQFQWGSHHRVWLRNDKAIMKTSSFTLSWL